MIRLTLLKRRRPSRWIFVMAGPDVILVLRQALPARWYRLLPVEDQVELERRLQIVIPSIILVELPRTAGDLVLRMGESRRRHPQIPWIAVLDATREDLARLLAEHRMCRTLFKPLDVRKVREAVETEMNVSGSA